MIRKSGYRFSEKIMLKQKDRAEEKSSRSGVSGMTRRVAANRASTSRRFRKSRVAHMRGNRASIRSNRTSMPALAFLHRRELLGTGRPLICRLPGLVGHAVDGLAALVLGHRSAFGVRLVLEPVRQAIAAEAREVHQVDVLDIGAAAQMFDEAPEHRGFKFRSGFVVDCHDCYLAAVRRTLILSGSCHRVCHIEAQ